MILEINIALFNFINHNLQNPVFDSVMPILTHFGGFKFLVMICIILVIVARLRRKSDAKRIFLTALLALLVAGFLTFCIKNVVQAPRPFMSIDNVHLLITEDDLNSFPSGHATSTFAVVTVLVMNMKDLVKEHVNLASAILIVFACAIAFSRIYVGVHFPLDILAGSIIGVVVALIVNEFKDRIFAVLHMGGI